ncbi:MAG: tetratricopeptide repeat protein [Planctomycetota bacterium]
MDWKVVNRLGIGTGIALGIGFMFASSGDNGPDMLEGMSRPGQPSSYDSSALEDDTVSARPRFNDSADAMYGVIETAGDDSTFHAEAYANEGTLLPPEPAPQQDFLTQSQLPAGPAATDSEDDRWQFQEVEPVYPEPRLPGQVALPVVNSPALADTRGYQVNDLYDRDIQQANPYVRDTVPPVAASHQAELMDIRPVEVTSTAPPVMEMVEQRVETQQAPSESRFDQQMFQQSAEMQLAEGVAAVQGRAAGYAVPDSVAQKAAHHVEYGKSLARRGATHAARQEFYHAIRLIAQSMDANTGQTRHTDSLRRAIVTLRESTDFHIEDSELQMMANVSVFVEAHTCDVLTVEQASQITSIQALQIYFAAALENLVAASGNHVVSAEALYSLGKLHGTMSRHEMTSEPLDIARSILYHRAALACDESSYRSANELGAMLARSGQAAEAIELFKRSLRIRRTPQAWHNLATVHQRLGQDEFAARARSEHQRMTAPNSAYVAESPAIEWVEPEVFNQSSPWEFPEQQSMQQVQTVPPVPAARVSQVPEQPSRGFFDRVKDTIDGLR